MFSLLLHHLLPHPRESLPQVFPAEAAADLTGLLLDSALHIILYMHSFATNKSVAPQQSSLRLSQPDLHAKILNLVANRMQPSSSTLLLQKQSCGSCVTPSPAATTKRNSLAATRMKDRQSRVNQTLCDGSSPLEREGLHLAAKKSGGSTSNLTKQFLMKHARKMAIDSKVVSVSIEHSKVGDFTIDLRGEMPTQFVNVKMMSKLRLENAQKERRITQLESEVLQLHDRIIEMSLNLEQKSKETFSDMLIPSNASINKISEINDSKPQKEGSILSGDLAYGMKRMDGKEQSLLRILKMQANQIQRWQGIMQAAPPRQRQKRHSFQ